MSRRRVFRPSARFPAWALCLAVGAVASAELPPVYRIVGPGFTDAEHTGASGQRRSVALLIGGSGAVVGSSTRYVGSDSLGRSAWIHDDGLTTRIGLIGPEYTRPDGAMWSDPIAINAGGDVLGDSDRFVGDAHGGLAAWIHRAGKSTRLGYFDESHTGSDGYGYSPLSQTTRVQGMNDSGQVIGYSRRYTGGYFTGYSAWVWSDGVYTPLGLIDAAHTHESGADWTIPVAINTAGQVAGWTYYWADCPSAGASAWLYSKGATTPIGLSDGLHTNPDCGAQESQPVAMNEDGDVIGFSLKFPAIDPGGDSAWIFHDGATTRIGLFDAEHMIGEREHSRPIAINAQGQVIGTSARRPGERDQGQSAWAHTDGQTVRLGFFDSEHTRSDGRRYSSPFAQNSAGQVIGRSELASPSGSQSAWLWTGGQLVRLGYFDAAHTGPDGYRFSEAVAINEAGLVTGWSTRDDPAPWAGRRVSAWVFDSEAGETIPIVPQSQSNSIYARPMRLTQNGVVLGVHWTAADLGGPRRFFRWSHSGGFEDLGALVSGGLDASEFNLLGLDYDYPPPPHSFDASIIAGPGETPGFNEEAFILAPTVRGDLNGDCTVDVADLGVLLSAFTQPGAPGLGDLNANGVVDTADLGLLIGAFGDACD